MEVFKHRSQRGLKVEVKFKRGERLGVKQEDPDQNLLPRLLHHCLGQKYSTPWTFILLDLPPCLKYRGQEGNVGQARVGGFILVKSPCCLQSVNPQAGQVDSPLTPRGSARRSPSPPDNR